MTDIVDRLRAGWSMPSLAADEIERLRAYSDELAASYQRLTGEASEEIGRLRVALAEKTREVETARSEWARWQQSTDDEARKRFDAETERDALRAKVERAVELCGMYEHWRSVGAAEVRALRAILTAPPEPSASPDRVQALDAWARQAWPDGRPGTIGDEPSAEAKPNECPRCGKMVDRCDCEDPRVVGHEPSDETEARTPGALNAAQVFGANGEYSLTRAPPMREERPRAEANTSESGKEPA